MPAHKGTKHHKARLTEDQVREIREKYATGNTSHWKLALEYDLAPSGIGNIIYRKTWRHVL